MTRPTLRRALVADDVTIKARVGNLSDFKSLAVLLEVPAYVLKHVLDRVDAPEAYRRFSIPKRSGKKRVIDAPRGSLAILQRKLAYVLGLLHEPRGACHGFTRGRSIVTNARPHEGRRWVVSIDIKDFFPAINFGRVQGVLASGPFNFPPKIASACARLACRNGRLPQGSPASPIISNLVARHLDSCMTALARDQRMIYSRYADDLTLSHDRSRLPREVARRVLVAEDRRWRPGTLLVETLERAGFKLNPKKFRVRERHQRQEVTGLIVNERTSVPRSVVRRLRAQVHAWRKFGYKKAAREFKRRYAPALRSRNPRARPPSLKRHMIGTLEYIRMVRGDTWFPYVKLQADLASLTKSVRQPGEALLGLAKHETFDVFISHASEDKPKVVEPLVRALKRGGLKVWYDTDQMGWGDDLIKSLDAGLQRSRFVVPIITASFVAKQWPKQELRSALNREYSNSQTKVLPLFVGTGRELQRLRDQFPMMADKMFKRLSSKTRGEVVGELVNLVAARREAEASTKIRPPKRKLNRAT